MGRAFTFLPSSTLAARGRRHLPQARAWAVHLPSSRPCQHGGGDIGITVKGFYQPGASSSPRPFELISWTRLRPLPRVCDAGRFCFASFTQTSPLPTLTFVCSVSHTAGATVTLDGAHVPGFSGSTHVEGQELPSLIAWGALCL